MSLLKRRNVAQNLCTILLLLVAIAFASPALGQDTQPPVVTSFTFSPMAVNTTSSAAAVSLTAQVTDNLSGVALVNVIFVSPSHEYSVSSGNLGLTGGTDLNGTWTGSVTIPAYTEAGAWAVFDVEVVDNVENSAFYYTSQLQSLGFPTSLQVTSNQDTQPPVLTGFTFSPTAVNTTTNSATVNLTAQVTDNLSGVALVNVLFVSPSGDYSVSSGNLGLISGTDLNGTWAGTVVIPAYTEAGAWSVKDIEVIDDVQNTANYSTSGIQSLGFPTTLLVTSNQDTQPPVLTAFTFSPMSVNTSTNSAIVNLSAQVTDNLSGVALVNVIFVSPSGEYSVSSGNLGLNSGTDLNGTWTGPVTIPAYSEAGAWSVFDVEVIDNVQNSFAYYTSNLQSLGFPTQLIVDSTTTVALTSSTNPSTYDQSVTFTATVTSGGTNIPTGTVNFNDGPTTIGIGTLNSSGVATFTTKTLAVGTHSIVAAYLGDSGDPAANSAPVTQTVTQAPTVTTVTSSRNPSIAERPVTFTASVSFLYGLPPNGEWVEFLDGQTKIGAAALTNGVATLTMSGLTAGVHFIVAEYSGDATLRGSKSARLRQGVNP